MIIEIGTSDFNTSAGVKNGIYIEPVKYYFDRLPNDCKKENVAISNYEGTCKIYYVDDETIKRNNAPDWLRGCSSINTKHIRLLKYIPENEIIEREVRVERIKNIISKYNVSNIDLLKIDTEGHDTVILNDYLDTVKILPKKIQFENNILSNKSEVTKLIIRLEKLGYSISHGPTDVFADLKTSGILLIVFGYQYDKIAPDFIKNLRKFSNLPILIHTNIPEEYRNSKYSEFKNLEFIYHEMFDDENRIIKTNLIKYTKFDKTLYVDVDSEILSKDFLLPFNHLEDFDICAPVQHDGITRENINQIMKEYSTVFIKKISEIIPKNFFILGGGVCFFKKNERVEKFFKDFNSDWLLNKGRDMPSLFYSYYKNINNLRLKKLSIKEYNGTNSTIIKSLHDGTIKYTQLGSGFIRRRFDPIKNEWGFLIQGEKKVIKIPKIALLYDVKGWAFYNMSQSLKKYLSDYYDIDVVKFDKFVDKNYDSIVSFSPLATIKNTNKNKIIQGISSHKNYELLKDYDFVFSNDENIHKILKNKNKYYTPNGVDTNFYNGKPKQIKNNKIRIGLIGSKIREEHKGSNRIDKICEKLKNLGYEIENKKLIIDSTNTSKILDQKQMKSYYENIDVFIISSVSETGPNPLLEAMSMGVPVISNRVGLAPKLLVNNETGFLIENYNDIDTYVKHIEDIIKNKELYSKISNNSIKKVKNYDWNVLYFNFKLIIDDFIKNNSNSNLRLIKSFEASILIPTYNNIEYLDESLNSIINSGKNHNVEILVGIDGCEKTLNYVKQKTYPDFVKFYYFNSNNGPYDIKNTLTKISNSDKIIFFDSDDIMTDSTITEVINNLGRYDLVRLKYKEIRNSKTLEKTNFHEGAIGINKNLFLSMNGFEPWMCAADSDFLGRLYKRRPRIYHTKNLSMYYRRHDTSLTMKKETGMSSSLRGGYARMSKNKKGDGNPDKLYTRDFVLVDVNTIVVDLENHEYYNHRESQLNKVLNPVPRKVVNQPIKKKDPVINDRTDILYLNQKPLVRTIKPNKPDNRQDLINLKNNTNKSIHKELFSTKPERRTGINPITIGGKSRI